MREFLATDRCDRCGARALHSATKPGMKSELLFCNHHHAEHNNALLEQYWLIVSDMSFAEPVPASAYNES